MKIYLLIIFSFHLLAACAQVEDHFDDGDFTNSPAWSGDQPDFIVNAASQLQLNASIAGNSFLSVPANLTTIDSTEWRFFIRLNFSPSSSNYARVYLSADQSNWQQPLNGYFVQFGEALSNDAIEIFRQDGTTLTPVCRGRDGLIANAFSAGVKVIRSSSGVWTLYVDYNGGINYSTEAAGTDSLYNTSGWIGVNCIYTGGNTDKFYFDDFYAGPEIRDTILPFVTEVNVENDSLLSVMFSERMDSSSVSDLSNFSVHNGTGHPAEIYNDSISPLKYFLKFSAHFISGINYVISFSGLRDVAQNQMLNHDEVFNYSPVAPAFKGDVVFSEIYYEPVALSPLPNSEYVEIYNRKDSSITISGWIISDGTSDGLVSPFRIGAHDFAVLYSENDSSQFLSIPNAVAVHSFPTLNNDIGDDLVLSDSSGNRIDELKFNDTFYHDNNKNDGGWSIERIDPNFICADAGNWKASVSSYHGTPGLINSVLGNYSDTKKPFVVNAFLTDSFTLTILFSKEVSDGGNDVINYRVVSADGDEINPSSVNVHGDSADLTMTAAFSSGTYTIQVSALVKDCPGNGMETHSVRFGFPEKAGKNDVIINELLFNSYTGGNDYLELYNRAGKIIDLDGWIISEADYDDSAIVKETALITNSHRLLFPGDYILLSRDAEKVKPFYMIRDPYAFLDVSSMPDFSSDKGRAMIYDKNGNSIDAFRYSDAMHFPLIANTKGISLERIDPEILNDEQNNWHSAAATAGFGTPGYGNSERVGLVTDGTELSVEQEIFSPDNDGYHDVLVVHYNFNRTGTVLSLNVYNINGLPVRNILSGETVGGEGMLNWDGLKDDRTIASEGIYILLAKTFDLNGDTHETKMVCYLTRKN